jgi:flagellar biosynthesis/type III secretory pathway protein FliH
MSAKQVEAQDFVNKLIITQEYGLDDVSALRDFDALLSQARQEAASEKEEEMRRYMEQKIKEAKGIARRDGRLEGLKEMDEAHRNAVPGRIINWDFIEKLRQEYQQPN